MERIELVRIAGALLLAALLFSGCGSKAEEDTAVPSGSGKGQSTSTAPTATTTVQLNH